MFGEERLTFNALAGPDLVFPLSRHYFGVDTRDIDASVQAGLVVRLNDVAAVHLAGANAAIVWALRTRKSALWPSVRPSAVVKQSIFLFEPEPEMAVLIRLHQPCGLMAVVELVGASIWIPGLAHNDHIRGQTDRVGEECNRTNVDVRVVARSLVGRRAVEVPFWKLVNALDRRFRDGLYDGIR